MQKLSSISQEIIHKIIELDQKFLNYFWNDNQWIDFLTNNSEDAYLLYNAEGQEVYSFALFLGNYADNSLHLLKVVTHPLKRGEGMASQLIKAAQESGVFKHPMGQGLKIFLEVSTMNFTAIKVYEELGFERTRFIKKFYSDGSDALEMLYQRE